MSYNEDPIKFDPEAGGVLFEPKDWRVCPRHFGLMHHLPTGAEYFVELPEELRGKDQLSTQDFQSWLVRIREMPSFNKMIEHGRAAIAVFLIENGFWAPKIVEVPERPKRRRLFMVKRHMR